MANNWDANIKLLYPVDLGTFFTIDNVGRGKAFDVIANVEIGEDLNGVVDRHDIRVGIVNLTRSKAVGPAVNDGAALSPQSNQPLLQELRINIPGGWDADADAGDVLRAVASYRVTAGVHSDASSSLSIDFVVS
jgi:hypothetical protein